MEEVNLKTDTKTITYYPISKKFFVICKTFVTVCKICAIHNSYK